MVHRYYMYMYMDICPALQGLCTPSVCVCVCVCVFVGVIYETLRETDRENEIHNVNEPGKIYTCGFGGRFSTSHTSSCRLS